MARSAPCRLAGALILGAVLVACSPTVNSRGHILHENNISQIKPGVHTREDVRSLLGTPSSTAAFDEQTWYYIGKRTASVAFFKPRLLDQVVLEIEFDNAGVVREVRRLGTKDHRSVDLVERETPTAGKDLTFIQQLIGSFTRVGRGGPVDRDL